MIAGVAGSVINLPIFELAIADLRATLVLAICIDKSCGENAIEPGFEIGTWFKLMEGDEGLGIGILNEILGILRILGVTHGCRVQLIGVLQRVTLKARLLLGRALSGAINDRDLRLIDIHYRQGYSHKV